MIAKIKGKKYEIVLTSGDKFWSWKYFRNVFQVNFKYCANSKDLSYFSRNIGICITIHQDIVTRGFYTLNFEEIKLRQKVLTIAKWVETRLLFFFGDLSQTAKFRGLNYYIPKTKPRGYMLTFYKSLRQKILINTHFECNIEHAQISLPLT